MSTSKRIKKTLNGELQDEPSDTNSKSCDQCSHALNINNPSEVLCIANAPTVLSFQGEIQSRFPAMMKWGMCDQFHPGKPQFPNQAPA